MIDQKEIHNQCYSEDPKVRRHALEQLQNFFSSIPDKQQAWDDLHILIDDQDSSVRSSAAKATGSAFSQVPDKKQAWNDLHRLTDDENGWVKSSAARAIGSAFSQVPDKQQAWEDLLILTLDQSNWVRFSAASALISAFSQMPDKQQAWNDLFAFTIYEKWIVRSSAAYVLGYAYPHVPDKQQAWDDLHILIDDQDGSVRSSAAEAIGSAFSQVPDKKQAWDDLIRLTNNEDDSVRSSAAEAIGSVFSQVPDKKQAWNDLHRLIDDQDGSVRSSAAEAIGSAFSQVPDKKQAWNDLHRLINDEESYVRASSNHSLGRVSIFMASQAETDEDYKKELEIAIEFFETAVEEVSYDKWANPSQFCLPFYRSFHTIVFKKQEAKEEVDRYLEEAKAAIGDSESKKQLYEAVENLANALKEVQNLGNLDLLKMKGELNFYRKYCDRAAELMKNTDEKAPFATEVLRKGFPILDRNFKKLLEEIQEKAKIVCEESKGTATEEIACAVNREVQKWEIDSQKEMTFCAKNLCRALKLIIPPVSENKFILNEIENALNEKNLINLFTITSTFIGSIPALKMVTDKLNNLEYLVLEVNSKVDELVILSKPGFSEEFVISSGIQLPGLSAEHVVTIPLQEISYFELKEDLEKIKGKSIEKISQLPIKLAEKLKNYLLRIERNDILKRML
ncbi:hypothetical protein FXV91_09815 [Methanosarcina sp. DH2]|uniref:HEAT repeat domain-containing protein n=1 Tax=Methanosarcina sp. DH2 TaxID=2605639 RepID=UPI001E310D80|nr:HEAT repeat domain-containing protein [Methanosarcina sp. DH2]MCC4770470.1 hypothetical protein [Methanosarcina sp. DH2]